MYVLTHPLCSQSWQLSVVGSPLVIAPRSAIQEVPEDETNDWMAHTAGPSSSSTDTAKASTGRTGSSKKPAGKEGEAPESAEAPTIVGAIEGDDVGTAFFCGNESECIVLMVLRRSHPPVGTLCLEGRGLLSSAP